jgi:UMF1 family MFS transporter
MFDFANSSYTTIVITAIYSAFFVRSIVGQGTYGDWLWSVFLGVSYLMVLVTAPLLGAVADAGGKRKHFLFLSYICCVVFTALLFFPGKGDIWLAGGLIILSNFGYASGEVFIGSYLPQLSTRKNIGRVSGYGWAFGYVGGILSLLLCLLFLQSQKGPEGFSLMSLRLVPVLAAAFFLLAGIPTFRWLPEPVAGRAKIQWKEGFPRLWQTGREIKRFRQLVRFFIAFFFYSCGIGTVITFSAIFAKEVIHFKENQLLILIIIVNVISSIGAFAFGFVQDKLGIKKGIAVTIVIWIIATFWAGVVKTQTEFWIIAILVGLAMGGSQSGSRALVGRFSPRGRLSEFFGFWGTFSKLASLVGIFSYGTLAWLTGDRRLAITFTGLLFVVGLILLWTVNEGEGAAAAEEKGSGGV